MPTWLGFVRHTDFKLTVANAKIRVRAMLGGVNAWIIIVKLFFGVYFWNFPDLILKDAINQPLFSLYLQLSRS